MRTTLVLDDELLRQAKVRAAERSVNVSDIVNEALRETLSRPPAAAPPFSLITYGGSSGKRVHHEPSDFAAALEEEDRDRLRRRC